MSEIIQIPLNQGYFATIDAADYEKVSQFKWYVTSGNGSRTRYAICNDFRSGKKRTTQMHRLLMDAPDGVSVDHIDRDGLNNTRSNLRLATLQENLLNKGADRDCESGYRGVFRRAGSGRWVAVMSIHGRRINIGSFDNPEDAARAYNALAREFRGEFAAMECASQQYEARAEEREAARAEVVG